MFYGLTKLQVRQLAYKFAETKKIPMPKSWTEKEAAGEDWLRGFRKRSGKLSLRNPESTSLARSVGFNRPAVDNFFCKLKEALLRDGTISPQNISNLDETGISTVVKPSKILAKKGVKQIGRISSAERGVSMTMCCCINAIGNALPPVYIFPRVHFKNYMLKDAPAGSLGLAYPSGWMTGDLFAETLGHFIKFMKISKSNPGLLLMDNHISHLSIEAIDIAKENGLCLLTFPPHCSHKLQPLDIGVYGPFKRYYSSFCDSWMTSNPGKPLSMYEVAELSSHAFHKAITIENITSSFRSSGIHPFNPDVFPDDAFLPALVTDIPLQLDEADSSTAPSTSASAFTNVAERETLNDEELLAEINPYPKANVSQKRPNKRRRKSAIISLLIHLKKKISFSLQKSPEKTISSSSESNISIHLLSDSTSFQV